MRRGLGAGALREPSYGIHAGHHVVQPEQPQQDQLLRELLIQTVEVSSLQSGHLHRDSRLHNPAAPQRLLFHHGFANSTPTADNQPRREAEQNQNPSHDHRSLDHFLLLLHPIQRQFGFLRASPDQYVKRMLRGVGGADYLPHRPLHRRLQLLLRPDRLLLHLGHHPELHQEEEHGDAVGREVLRGPAVGEQLQLAVQPEESQSQSFPQRVLGLTLAQVFLFKVCNDSERQLPFNRSTIDTHRLCNSFKDKAKQS